MSNSIFERWQSICLLILQLCGLNFLWIIFSLLGIGIFGVGPATIAMLAVIRKIIRKKDDGNSMISTYWTEFRNNFISGNFFFFLYFIMGYILYVNWLYVHHSFLQVMFVIATLLYMISLVYIFPILVHYDWKGVVIKIKYSLIFGVSHLHYTLVLFVTLFLVYFLFNLNLGIFSFFGVSFTGFIIMWFTHQVFLKVEYNFYSCEDNKQEHSNKIIKDN